MEPKFEQPKQYTQEEIAEMEKSRTISDAELLKDGAEYVVDEKGEKRLSLTEYQLEKEIHATKVRNSFTTDAEKEKFDLITKRIESLGIIPYGSKISVDTGKTTYGYALSSEYRGFDEKGVIVSSRGDLRTIPWGIITGIQHS